MRLKRFILFFIGVFSAYWSAAQLKGEYIQTRVLIVLDGSSSMTQPWASGKLKYKAAQDLIMSIIDSAYAVNRKVQFGLRVFGHQSTVPEKNCYDTRNEVPFSTDNRSQMLLRLEDIHPVGITPIAFALKEAAEKDITDEAHNAYTIILITDGGESCGGDICEVMKTMMSSKVHFKPYIVSLENDPGLKATYDCMGNFLQVTNDNEMPRAVGIIIDELRPVLKLSQEEYDAITANAPSVLKVNRPKKVGDNIAALAEATLRPVNIPDPVFKKPAVVMPGILPPVKADPVFLRANVTGIAPTRFKELKTSTPSFAKLKPVLIPALPPVVADNPMPRDEKVAKLKPAPVAKLYWAMVMEQHALSRRPLPKLPPVKVEIPPKPVGQSSNEFTTASTDDKETSLEVYFTDGKGKFYSTTPQIALTDPATKMVAKKFYRTVDADGKPDPQTGIPEGTYDLTIPTKPNFVIKGVSIERNKKRTVTIVVPKTTLSFVYVGAPGRPVKEFKAIVTERNKAHGRVETQPCDTKVEYEPGNYHIEILTFPTDHRNSEFDFDFEKELTVPQPGFAKFVTDGSIHSVGLYQQLGGGFVRFSTIDPGPTQSKPLQIQPGAYQVHYQKGPGPGAASEKVILFHIKPTEETIIELK